MTATTNIRRLGEREGKPAVNIRDHIVWSRNSEAGPLIHILPETVVDECYAEAVAIFWEQAAVIAAGVGYKAWSAGRMGGWLYVTGDGTSFLDSFPENDPWLAPAIEGEDSEDDTRARAVFLGFAAQIIALQEACGAEFIRILGERVTELAAA